MLNKLCDQCGRAIRVGEPYTSFDFITQRFDDDGNVVLLEGHEMSAHCAACGYDLYDTMAMHLMGVAAEEEVA